MSHEILVHVWHWKWKVKSNALHCGKRNLTRCALLHAAATGKCSTVCKPDIVCGQKICILCTVYILCCRNSMDSFIVGLDDISHAICMRISSLKPVPWLAVNLHHLFSNGAAFNTQSRKSLTSYAISRSYRRPYISRYMRSLPVQF